MGQADTLAPISCGQWAGPHGVDVSAGGLHPGSGNQGRQRRENVNQSPESSKPRASLNPWKVIGKSTDVLYGGRGLGKGQKVGDQAESKQDP